MLPATKGVAMGWLDKLLGREKKEPYEASTEEVEGSAVDRAEDRASEAREEAIEAEGRIPPGTG
ncbi:MAG TPA: hypothetical protein VFR63_12255 [Gaiellaceae bacterium]|nr:hypothetical protein [Gaiellaceae bacterium]